MPQPPIDELLELILRSFIGQECWGVVAGAGAGSIFQLSLGAKSLRPESCRNPHLALDVQLYQPSHNIFYWAAWELYQDGVLVCDSDSDNANDGPMVRGLQRLIGEKITRFDASKKWHEPTVHWSGGYRLDGFCNAQDIYQSVDSTNYSLTSPVGSISCDGDHSLSDHAP